MKLSEEVIEKLVKIMKENVHDPDDLNCFYVRADLKKIDLVLKFGDPSQSILVENK